MLANLWPLSFEALCHYWVPGLKGLGILSEAGPESQLALGSAWTALGEWGTDGGTPPDPPNGWKAGGLRHGFKLMRSKCEPRYGLVSMFPETCFYQAPFLRCWKYSYGQMHPEFPSSLPQLGTGGGLFVGILRMVVGTCLVVGNYFSHTKYKLFFLRGKADWKKPLIVLLSQAFCQWLAH